MTFCEYLYEATDNTKHGLDQAKKNALICYKVAKKAVLDTNKLPTELYNSITWSNFCEAKKVCMMLGVNI